MSQIKSATTYKLELPSAVTMETHLYKHAFTALSDHEYCKSGFTPIFDGFLVEPFHGGYAFSVRYDEKIIPSSVLHDNVKKAVSEIELNQARRLQKKERQQIKERIYMDMLPIAFIKTQNITCFYVEKERLLIVSTQSKKIANIVTTRLAEAVESIKSTAIYIDEMKKGLTAKLKDYLEGHNDVFGGFNVLGECKIKSEGKAVSFKTEGIEDAREGIIEAIDQGGMVVDICLWNDVVKFKINSDYIMRRISFLVDKEGAGYDDDREKFQHESAIETALFSDTNNKLLDLFECKTDEVAA
jgi:recombination associated protein RdgC